MISNSNYTPSNEIELLKSIGYHSDHFLDVHNDSFTDNLKYAFDDSIERHQREAKKILSPVNEPKVSIEIDPVQGIFTEIQNNVMSEKEQRKKKRLNRENMEEFCKFSEQRMVNDHILRTNMEYESKNMTEEKLEADTFLKSYLEFDPNLKTCKADGVNVIHDKRWPKTASYIEIEPNPYWKLSCNVDGVKTIRDKEWPLIASFIRVLIANPHSNSPYPTPTEFYKSFTEARKLRLEIINNSKYYELFSENRLVFKKSGNDLEFYDKKRFVELCTPLKNDPLLEIIDESFIENAIKSGYSPKDCRKKLEKFKGLSIRQALEVESSCYGNRKKVNQILEEELQVLDPLDQFVFSYISHLCNKDLHGKGHDWNSHRDFFDIQQDSSKWHKVTKKYKYLEYDWTGPGSYISSCDKIKKIFKYLSGKNEITTLNLNPNTNLEVLKIIKLAEMAMSVSNNKRFKKINFERGSYKLKELIMQQNQLPSFAVFSKTLIDKKILDINNLMISDNWDDERVGMQAKLFANSLVLSNALSCRIKKPDNQKLISCRGNTASGKTSILGDDDGILNVDFIKAHLKKLTGVTNAQVYEEGKFAIFEHLFSQIANYKIPNYAINATNTDMSVSLERLHYILDSRLIKSEFIKTYLVDPAKLRNYTVVLNDLDVPLITTFNRVLKRDPKGKDPIPTIEAMASGFKQIRQYRSEVIKYVENESTVEEYNLFYSGKKVATKTATGKIEILDPDYLNCFKIPSDVEMEKTLDRMIDDEYIKEAIIRGDIKEEEGTSLEYWKGKTVRFALDAHAKRV